MNRQILIPIFLLIAACHKSNQDPDGLPYVQMTDAHIVSDSAARITVHIENTLNKIDSIAIIVYPGGESQTGYPHDIIHPTYGSETLYLAHFNNPGPLQYKFFLHRYSGTSFYTRMLSKDYTP